MNLKVHFSMKVDLELRKGDIKGNTMPRVEFYTPSGYTVSSVLVFLLGGALWKYNGGCVPGTSKNGCYVGTTLVKRPKIRCGRTNKHVAKKEPETYEPIMHEGFPNILAPSTGIGSDL